VRAKTASLVVGDDWLGDAEFFGELDLREAALVAQSSKAQPEDCILFLL
jgi:hypothetical protein